MLNNYPLSRPPQRRYHIILGVGHPPAHKLRAYRHEQTIMATCLQQALARAETLKNEIYSQLLGITSQSGKLTFLPPFND